MKIVLCKGICSLEDSLGPVSLWWSFLLFTMIQENMKSLSPEITKCGLGYIHILLKGHRLPGEPLQACSSFFKLDGWIAWMCGSLNRIKVLHSAEFTALFVYWLLWVQLSIICLGGKAVVLELFYVVRDLRKNQLCWEFWKCHLQLAQELNS